MFGERYFANRERLSEVVSDIVALARETGVNATSRLNQNVLDQGLSTPFLFVVCGETNAGKSTLLNALFGEPVCKVNLLPETDRVICYKYGLVRKDVQVTEDLLEKYAPINFLKNFNLVDTPGTNSLEKSHQAVSAGFMAGADLLLFVFPISNPWGAATWDFLCRQSEEVLDKVVFVIQQCDQREPADIRVILGHLRDLAMKRIGRVPPVFPISGKMAYEGKISMPFGEEKRRKSGIVELEDFISQSVCDSPSRQKMLQNLRVAAMDVMREVEDKIEDHSRRIDRDGRFLEDVEREIDGMRALTLHKHAQSLGGISEVFQHEAHEVAQKLEECMSIGKSLVRVVTGENTAFLMESLIQQRLHYSVEEASSHDFAELIRGCCNHWASLQNQVKEAMSINIESTEEIERRLKESQVRFVNRMGRASTQSIGNLRVRGVLDLSLRQRNGSLRGLMVLTILLLIGMGVCGALAVPWAPLILLVLAMISGGFLCWVTVQTGREIVSEYRERLLNSGDAFSTSLRHDYEEGLRLFFRDYALGLEEVRKHLVAEKLSLQPRLQQWSGLFLAIKAIEQEIT